MWYCFEPCKADPSFESVGVTIHMKTTQSVPSSWAVYLSIF